MDHPEHAPAAYFQQLLQRPGLLAIPESCSVTRILEPAGACWYSRGDASGEAVLKTKNPRYFMRSHSLHHLPTDPPARPVQAMEYLDGRKTDAALGREAPQVLFRLRAARRQD